MKGPGGSEREGRRGACRLLVRGVEKRMTVAEALQHPWLSQESADLPLSPALLARLHAFTKQSRLQAGGLLFSSPTSTLHL